MRTALHVLSYLMLADGAKLSQVHQKLTRSIDDEESTASTVPAVLALRALLTRESSDAAAARASVTEAGEVKAARISVEVWLEELGFPLEVPPTQWLIPYEQVRENWLNVARRVIERAKAAPPLTAEMQEWWDARF